jgi:hypothetical protein
VKTGLFILSIHPSSMSEADLNSFIHSRDRQYPICRDDPGSNDTNDGATYERYRIATGPFAFVVGPDGKVVHYGLLPDLPEVRAYCEKLPPLPIKCRTTDGSPEKPEASKTAPADGESTQTDAEDTDNDASQADRDSADEDADDSDGPLRLRVGVQLRSWKEEMNFAGNYPPAPEPP